MAAKLENEYGVISIDREVIARIAGNRRDFHGGCGNQHYEYYGYGNL